MEVDHYLTPQSLDEAFEFIGQFSGRYRIIAGATDVIPQARKENGRGVHGSTIIDVSGIKEMSGVEIREKRIWMGANTTFSDFCSDPILREHAPVLAQCAASFADFQIREAATLGGNIVNASPAADGVPPVMAMNARVTLESKRDGKRQSRDIPLGDFLAGPGSTTLQAGEILTGIECDAVENYGSAFEKIGPRRSLYLSTVCLAVLVEIDPAASCFSDVRLALGAVGPVPVRLTECEDFLKGKPIRLDIVKEAAGMPLDRVQSRTRRDYRRQVVSNFVERGLINALAGLNFFLQEIPDHPARESHG